MRRLPAILILAAVTLVACGGPPPGPSSTSSPGPSPSPSVLVNRPLVTIETHGGECAAGECQEILRIDSDGTAHRLKPQPELVTPVPLELIGALQVEIDQANFPLIESRPFRETCPTAYDGQETIYTFHLPDGDEVLATCRIALDPNHPLFLAVGAAVASTTVGGG